jgi:hypothetical protein
MAGQGGSCEASAKVAKYLATERGSAAEKEAIEELDSIPPDLSYTAALKKLSRLSTARPDANKRCRELLSRLAASRNSTPEGQQVGLVRARAEPPVDEEARVAEAQQMVHQYVTSEQGSPSARNAFGRLQKLPETLSLACALGEYSRRSRTGEPTSRAKELLVCLSA